jgi:hypothetical protein
MSDISTISLDILDCAIENLNDAMKVQKNNSFNITGNIMQKIILDNEMVFAEL